MNTPSSGTVDLEYGDSALRKRLTLTFRNLNIRVTAPDAALGETLLSYADPRHVLDFFRKSRQPKRVCFGELCAVQQSVANSKPDYLEGC
jgi:hypothetical protein